MKNMFSLLAAGLFTLGAVSCSKAPEPAQTGGLFTIRVAGDGTANSETLIADAKGFFKDEGIKIQWTGVLQGGISEFQALAMGTNDAFINSHPPTVAQARLAGVKVVAVAPGMVDNPDFPHVRYLVKDSSPIKTLSDIVGKKVAISGTAPCTDGYLKWYLKQKNLAGDVDWVTLPTPGQMEQSLKQGLVDVSTSHPPYAGVVLKQGGVRQVATSWDLFHSPAAGLSVRGFTEKFIQQHPDEVRAFCRVLARAHHWINTHQTEARDIVAKKAGLKPELVSIFWYDEDLDINPTYVDKWFAIAEDIGLWKKGAIQASEVFTNDFAPKEQPKEVALR